MSLVPLDCPCSCIVLVTEINNRRHLPGSEHSVHMTDSDSNTGSFLSSQRWISRLFQNWWRKQCQAQENGLGEHIMPSLMPTQETPGTKNTTWSTGDGKEDEWIPGFSPRLSFTWPGIPLLQQYRLV